MRRAVIITGTTLLSAFSWVYPMHRPQSTNEYVANHRIVRVLSAAGKRLLQSSVNSIFEDNVGNYWIGTLGGLELYDEKQDVWSSFKKESGELTGDDVTGIVQSGDSKLWVLPRPAAYWFSDGLSCFDGRYWRKVDRSNSALGDREKTLNVYAMFSGQNGKVWFTVIDTLVSYNNGRWSSVTNLSRKVGDPVPITIKSGLEDRDGDVWLGGALKGIIRLNKVTGKLKLYDPSKYIVRDSNVELSQVHRLAATDIGYIYEDRKGRIWFAASDGHVYVHNKNVDSWAVFDLPNSLAVGSPGVLGVSRLLVLSMYEDYRGQMMFATNFGLITLVEEANQWNIYTPQNSGLPHHVTRAIMEDKLGRIWIGTGRGIVVLEK